MVMHSYAFRTLQCDLSVVLMGTSEAPALAVNKWVNVEFQEADLELENSQNLIIIQLTWIGLIYLL